MYGLTSCKQCGQSFERVPVPGEHCKGACPHTHRLASQPAVQAAIAQGLKVKEQPKEPTA